MTSDSDLTANSVLRSTLHDRERREQRSIAKLTLQEARRYGMAQQQANGRIRYDYAGHVFIYDPRTNRAITSYKKDPNYRAASRQGAENQGNTRQQRPKKVKEPKTGTRFQRPIMIQKSMDHIKDTALVYHETAHEQVRAYPEYWSSNTVFIVDMSGSMREDDVNGARCRSDGVWTSLAKDFVQKQLEAETCSLYDVVSVVLMREEAEVVIECEPMDWVLYNKLVSFREWDTLKPYGHGFYKPALEKATEILSITNHGSCALSLLFFSDGKPSDYHKDVDLTKVKFNYADYQKVNDDLVQSMGKVAARFGRRLNIHCVGMAGDGEDFSALSRMATEAKSFGVQASFNQPDLSSDSLSQIVSSSVATSLSSRTELTSLKTGKMRSVRTDVEREKHNSPDDNEVTDNWRVFLSSDPDHYVMRVWKWNPKTKDFAQLIDPRCRICFADVADKDIQIAKKKGVLCPRCNACVFCSNCATSGAHRGHTTVECDEFARLRRQGYLVKGKPGPFAYNVAWKKMAFGEGAERLAFKFRYVTSNKKGKVRFSGPIMVAKESRFVEDFDKDKRSYMNSHRHTYHRVFLRTQSTAAEFANLFNEEVEKLLPTTQDMTCIPMIAFLEPLIFELEDIQAGATYNVLVEPLIEGKYRKYSDNKGNLAPELKRDFYQENRDVDAVSAALLLGRKLPARTNANATVDEGDIRNEAANLGVIVEESEDEDSDEDSLSPGETTMSTTQFGLGMLSSQRHKTSPVFSPATMKQTDYLETFSHFTWERSGGRLMVVDLQGTAGNDKQSGRCVYCLTDPAIHNNYKGRGLEEQNKFGRTNLGRRGMKAFFQTHVCNDACRLLYKFRDRSQSMMNTEE